MVVAPLWKVCYCTCTILPVAVVQVCKKLVEVVLMGNPVVLQTSNKKHTVLYFFT